MAMSASDRLKQILADKLKANKEKENESQSKNQEAQSQISNPQENKISGETKVDSGTTSISAVIDKGKQEESIKEYSKDVTGENIATKIVVAETPVSKESIQEKPSVFFDTPLSRMMQEFQTSLDNKLPGMASILRDIHLHLKKDPECVTQLSDEEIGTIVRGLESIQGQTIVTSPKTGKSKSGKSAPIVASML